MKSVDRKKIIKDCGLLHFIRLNIPNCISASKWVPLSQMQRWTLRVKFATAHLSAFLLISLAASLINLFKAGMLFGFWRWINLSIAPQNKNTRRCCLWYSLNSWHLWNLNGFTFSFFCRILRVVALEKSYFLEIWRIEEVRFSCIS